MKRKESPQQAPGREARAGAPLARNARLSIRRPSLDSHSDTFCRPRLPSRPKSLTRPTTTLVPRAEDVVRETMQEHNVGLPEPAWRKIDRGGPRPAQWRDRLSIPLPLSLNLPLPRTTTDDLESCRLPNKEFTKSCLCGRPNTSRTPTTDDFPRPLLVETKLVL